MTAGSTTGRQAADLLLVGLRARFRKVTLVGADGGYRGRLVTWAKGKLQLTLEIVKRSSETFIYFSQAMLMSRRLARRAVPVPSADWSSWEAAA
ncbi:hypothetical protein [Streptomyces sp. NRRL F-2664]|uniref:hypothetical protein n=1 Tax=Streptomyces sp. NRRL F-2664 TaxID=1463842 RepID=UPI000AFF477A|nr:hypothetical protein [Streptomyces sp. NRRL F-2664]